MKSISCNTTLVFPRNPQIKILEFMIADLREKLKAVAIEEQTKCPHTNILQLTEPCYSMRRICMYCGLEEAGSTWSSSVGKYWCRTDHATGALDNTENRIVLLTDDRYEFFGYRPQL